MMKYISLFLLTSLCLLAVQEKKIILAIFFNEKEARAGLKKSVAAFDNEFYALQNNSNFQIALLHSKNHYILALKPFKNIAAAKRVLPYAKQAYASAFISNYSKKINQLISTTAVTFVKEKEVAKPTKDDPIILKEEFLKPITVSDLINSSESHKPEKNVKAISVKPTESISTILYFFYALLSILIITLLIMVLRNSALKRELKHRDKILKTDLNHFNYENRELSSSIDTIELCKYLDKTLSHKATSIAEVQHLIDDILKVDALLHGNGYMNNREFQLSEITHAIAKRHSIVFNVKQSIPKTLIGDIYFIERIFLRFSYMSLKGISITNTLQNEEQIVLEFIPDGIYENINHVDTTLIVQLVSLLDGSINIVESDNRERLIKSFTLPFKLVEDSNYRVKRP